MKRIYFCLLVVLFALPTFAADYPNPVITSINPSFGPPSGGTQVTIKGDYFDLPPNFACALPCPVRVSFGGRLATLVSSDDEHIVVTTPEGQPGVVDVAVLTGDGRTTTAPHSFTYGGGPSPSYETVLLPVYTDGIVNGADGSKWATEFWLRNNGATQAQVAPWVCPADQVCPASVPLWRTVEAQETLHNLPVFFRVPTANVSRLLYVTADDASQISYSLRVADTSRQNLNAGTSLPVVRESQFLTKTAYLTDVPLDPAFRINLRVYEMAKAGAQFSVRVYPLQEGVDPALPIATYTVTPETTETGPFPSQAAYASLNVELARSATTPLSLRIEVQPLTAGSRFWTFATVTNNQTQLITTVTP
ncbi:MAG TPA: IPT/TIG domain-containing protein [Thermoanaerobaculia bacterium]